MKVALVHELLTKRGGAEEVLRVIADLFPDAPIYTLLYNEAKMGEMFPKERVRVSHIQNAASRYPLSATRFNHHLFLPFFARAVEAWDFSEYDLVISSSSAFAHGIKTSGKTRHLSYIHSPARYLWDRTHEIERRAASGITGFIRGPLTRRLFHRLRLWDSEAAERADMLLAPSQIVARRIELYWRRSATILPPPIADCYLAPLEKVEQHGRSFLIASQLVPYKHIELAVEACTKLKLPLLVAGEGPEFGRLKKMAGPSVTFLGYVSSGALRKLYSDAAALIVPGEEDFCLAAVECMACGTPVVALRRGGVTETVIDGQTGAFFDEPTVEALQETLLRFRPNDYAPDVCRERALHYARSAFEKGMMEAVKELTATR